MCHKLWPKSIPFCHHSTKWFTQSNYTSFLHTLNNLSALMTPHTQVAQEQKATYDFFSVLGISTYCWVWNATVNKLKVILNVYFGPSDRLAWSDVDAHGFAHFATSWWEKLPRGLEWVLLSGWAGGRSRKWLQPQSGNDNTLPCMPACCTLALGNPSSCTKNRACCNFCFGLPGRGVLIR